MSTVIETDSDHNVRAQEAAYTNLEAFARAISVTFAREGHSQLHILNAAIAHDMGKTSTEFQRALDEELAEHLLNDSMDRLTVLAGEVSELAAETAIDLALIEAARLQIDRAQAEISSLLRELTGPAP